jgi:hypothetical protein
MRVRRLAMRLEERKPSQILEELLGLAGRRGHADRERVAAPPRGEPIGRAREVPRPSASRGTRAAGSRSALSLLGLALGCGTVDAGDDFQIAEVVFDEGYYYCRVEPMLFAARCGPGDPDQDGMGSCHFNVTSFTLRDYNPLVGDNCTGNDPRSAISGEAKANYESAQRQMRVDPELAPLLNRPMRQTSHPRKIFDARSPQADVIRQWATRFSSQ